MKVLRWVLIQYDWSKKSKYGQQAHTEERPYEERETMTISWSRIEASEETNLAHNLEFLAFRMVRKQMSLV